MLLLLVMMTRKRAARWPADTHRQTAGLILVLLQLFFIIFFVYFVSVDALLLFRDCGAACPCHPPTRRLIREGHFLDCKEVLC